MALSPSGAACLPAGALLRAPHQLRGHRQLAFLDHPPAGRGLLRAVRDRPRGHHLPAARARHHAPWRRL